MDAFFATVPIRRKTRVHFHAFMRDVHDELATLKREADPLATVAARIARKWRLVCFDEFHVSDIADAMILGRLLTALFGHGVVFVMTSNYPPGRRSTRNGLQRQNFLPTIALLRARARRASRSTAASTTGCACSSRCEAYHCAARPRRPTPRWRRRSSAMRIGPGRDAAARRSRGGRSIARAAGRQRRLVRLRGAVRRPALAARLPGARAAVLRAAARPACRG